MTDYVSRKNFLKLGVMALSALAVNPFPPTPDDSTHPSGILGRITREWLRVLKNPLASGEKPLTYLRRITLNLYYRVGWTSYSI
jgi:hypothetical protein